jgi:hypothetical protein
MTRKAAGGVTAGAVTVSLSRSEVTKFELRQLGDAGNLRTAQTPIGHPAAWFADSEPRGGAMPTVP